MLARVLPLPLGTGKAPVTNPTFRRPRREPNGRSYAVSPPKPPFPSVCDELKNGKAVVLVVEDSPLIRMGAVELVLSAGYEALEAGDTDEAIRILELRTTSTWCSPMFRCRGPWMALSYLTTSGTVGRL